MLRGLIGNLILKEKIEITEAKAKEIKPLVDTLQNSQAELEKTLVEIKVVEEEISGLTCSCAVISTVGILAMKPRRASIGSGSTGLMT